MAAIMNIPAGLTAVPDRAGVPHTHDGGRRGPSPARGWHGLRRIAPRLVAASLLVGLAAPIAGGTHDAEAGKHKKAKTITRSFASSAQIAMTASGPANPYGAPIKITAFKKYKQAKIKDVNVILRNVSHDRPDDIDVMLVFGNKQAFILGDAGGSTGVSNLTLTLDDEASDELPNGSTLESGTYHPLDYPGIDNFSAPAPLPNGNSALSVFNGADPDGTWRLFVVDDAGTMTGEIAGGWKLEITAKVKKK
jgi:hypothetical protein